MPHHACFSHRREGSSLLPMRMGSVLTHPLLEQNMFLGKDLTSLISLTVRELDNSSGFKEEDFSPSSPLPQVTRSSGRGENDLSKTKVDSSVNFCA